MTHGMSTLGVMLPHLSAGVVISFQAGVVGVVGVGAPESEGTDASAAGTLQLFLHLVLPFLSSALCSPSLSPLSFYLQH